jgi:hypothetical protein
MGITATVLSQSMIRGGLVAWPWGGTVDWGSNGRWLLS